MQACDDEPSAETAGGNQAASPKAATGAKQSSAKGATAAEAQATSEFEEADFVEGPTNRDPFRSYMSEFLTPTKTTVKIQRRILMQRYGLEELQLIAVVTGGARARAMFRDPTGLGVSVKRGDYVSKSAGKIKQILADRVIIQLQESFEGGQRIADRVVELHPEEDRLRSRNN